MKKLFGILAALTLATPALAEPEIKTWNTHHSMGCMLLRECKEGVRLSNTVSSLEEEFSITFTEEEKEELGDILGSLRDLGIEVFVADSKYFVRNTRGIYHTEMNKFYLNPQYLSSASEVLSVIRHEGWHAAQDCMAGSLQNSHIAVIWNDGVVPQGYRLRADVLYGQMAAPWEAEAMWAMETPFQTANALRACASPDAMWDLYPPTPMTGEWLVENNYWNGVTK